MPVKSNPNIVLTYNSNNITAYCDQSTMDATVEAIETTNLASSATSTSPGDTTYSYDIGGDWDLALDAILGPDAIDPSTLRTFVAAIGESGSVATYTWTSGAFPSNYKVTAQAGANLKWTATLNLTVAAVRS